MDTAPPHGPRAETTDLGDVLMKPTTITLHFPAADDLSVPLPFQVAADGTIGRQEHWRGRPLRLVGFADQPETGRVDVHVEAWWNEPETAVNRYPVLVNADGSMATATVAVERITTHTQVSRLGGATATQRKDAARPAPSGPLRIPISYVLIIENPADWVDTFGVEPTKKAIIKDVRSYVINEALSGALGNGEVPARIEHKYDI